MTRTLHGKQLLLAAWLLSIAPVIAAQPAQPAMIAYPPAGKSERDQELERFHCHETAVKKSKFNPRTAQAYVEGVYGSSGGAAPRDRGYFGRSGDPGVDAAGGAVLGTAGGAIAGDVAFGVGGGIVAGTLFGSIRYAGREYRHAKHQQELRLAREGREREVESAAEVYRSVWSACMSELGYTVQ